MSCSLENQTVWIAQCCFLMNSPWFNLIVFWSCWRFSGLSIKGLFHLPEQILSNIKQEYKRMQKRRHLESSFQQTDSCCPLDSQPHASSSSAGTSSGSASPSRREQPLFTLRQVGMICERLLKEREEKVREEYDEILTTKLAEQYDAFVKFTHDQLMRRFGEQPASYVSWGPAGRGVSCCGGSATLWTGPAGCFSSANRIFPLGTECVSGFSLSLSAAAAAQCFLPSSTTPIYGPPQLLLQSVALVCLPPNPGYLLGFDDAFYTLTCHFILVCFFFCKMPFIHCEWRWLPW